MTQAFNFFVQLIKKEFPSIEVTLNWPSPNKEMKYPSMCILTNNSRIERNTPEFLLKETSGSVVTSFFKTGEWEVSLQIHYFSKRTKKSDQTLFIDKMTKVLERDFTSEKSNSPGSFVLPYGTRPFERAIVAFDSVDLDQGQMIQEGHRRCIFNCILDIPNISSYEAHILETPVLTDESSVRDSI